MILMRRLNNCHGFALLELLVVMTIIAVISAVVLPNYLSYYHRQRLEAQAYQLLSDIRYTQKVAQAEESALYYIRFFKVDGESYYQISKGEELVKTIKFYRDVNLVQTNFSDNRLQFRTSGLPVVGGTITLESNYTKQKKYVIVASVVGRVRVSDTPPESGY